MSGHSKWATIKRKKASLDSKRGKEFTKLIKEITVAARLGGGDPAANPRLRLLLDKAKEINMPLENATRAIKRGTGELPGTHYEAQAYEGYGPFGIAVMVDTLSDNKNRTVAELRHLFTANGGTLGETGSVSWMFDRLGVIRTTDVAISEDELLELLLDYDVKDIATEDGIFTITCDAKSLEKIRQAITQKSNLKIDTAELEWIPNNTVKVSGENLEKAYDFLNELEEYDDTQNVYTNLIEG